MDVDKIRRDFPILGGGVVYMDSAASSLTPTPVLKKIGGYYNDYRANIHRGVYSLSQIASEEYDSARRGVAGFINASFEELVFTKNTTEGINLIALSLDFGKGDRIITTSLEHHSNLLPWLRLRKQGVKVDVVNPGTDGLLDVDEFKKVVDDETRLVAVTHVSNVLGSVNPVKEIGEITREHDALYLVDGAQSAPHIKVDVKKIGCDFFAFSSHKMLGPTGVGALYMRKELAEKMEPAILGGGTIDEVSIEDYRLTKPPARWEAGTPNIGGVIGFGEAVNYLKETGLGNIEEHERNLTEEMVSGLREITGVEVYCPAGRSIGIIPFNLQGMNPHEVAKELDKKRIMVRSGHHCAMPLMNFLEINGCVRASLYLYNTKEEIGEFISALKEIRH